MRPWRVKMPTQSLLRLLRLLMLVMRIVLSTVCLQILKLMFCQYFAADVWLRLRNWLLVKILSLDLVEMLLFGWDFEVNAYLENLNLWYELNPRVRCAFGNVFITIWRLLMSLMRELKTLILGLSKYLISIKVVLFLLTINFSCHQR